MSATAVSHASYGKENVRLCKVTRADDGTHTVTEVRVSIMLEGALEQSFVHADNSPVIATDTQKHTCHLLAKQHPIDPPELFAAVVAHHFVRTYAHIHGARVQVQRVGWNRCNVGDSGYGAAKPHPHTFLRSGDELRVAEVWVRDGSAYGTVTTPGPFTTVSVPPRDGAPKVPTIDVRSGIDGLVLLKSTGSAFHGFIRDKYTRLPETWDRILSTEVKAGWSWGHFTGEEGAASNDSDAANRQLALDQALDQVRAKQADFDRAWDASRESVIRIFASENSASVQNTMYKMAQAVLDTDSQIMEADFALPNRHYFEIDMAWYGLENTGKNAEVYEPQTNPNGLISCTVTRGEPK